MMQLCAEVTFINTGWTCSSHSHKNQVEIPCAASPLLLNSLVCAHILGHTVGIIPSCHIKFLSLVNNLDQNSDISFGNNLCKRAPDYLLEKVQVIQTQKGICPVKAHGG